VRQKFSHHCQSRFDRRASRNRQNTSTYRVPTACRPSLSAPPTHCLFIWLRELARLHRLGDCSLGPTASHGAGCRRARQ
jgi:hypothetical protein